MGRNAIWDPSAEREEANNRLSAALGDMPLSAREARIVMWFYEWDADTVNAIASLVEKAAAGETRQG